LPTFAKLCANANKLSDAECAQFLEQPSCLILANSLTEICPNCGADVPPEASACPECGSCEQTGWSEQARYDRLDLPGQPFDYDDFIREEFGRSRPRLLGLSRFWWIVVVLLVLLGWAVATFLAQWKVSRQTSARLDHWLAQGAIADEFPGAHS
jgi:zinc-ribbon domain